MGITPKIKKVHLDVSQDSGSALFGMVSTEPDYKLSLALNKKLGISLRNGEPLSIHNTKNTSIVFSRFIDNKSAEHVAYELIHNRSGSNFLIRKLNNIDYVLHISDPYNEVNVAKLLSLLREIKCITALFIIDIPAIKDKNLQYIIK